MTFILRIKTGIEKDNTSKKLSIALKIEKMEKKIINAEDVKPNFQNVKKIWAKMLNGYYDSHGALLPEYIEEVNCPHCKNNSFEKEFILNGFRHVKCNSCSSVYVTPRLRSVYIDKLYCDAYYSEMYTKSMLPVFEKRKELIGRPKYKQVVQYAVSKGTVLDIGCGIGEVIDVFKDHHWECEVIELNPAAIEWLEKRDIAVTNTHFDDYSIDKKFDIIMAWNVIEHVLNPKKFLKKAYDLLKPGGVFVSEVPHGNSMVVDYCRNTGRDPQRILQGEQHIMLYSIKAYTELHENAGFHNLHVQTNGLDFSTIMNINGIELASEITSSIQTLIDSKDYGDLLRGFWRKL